MKKSLLLFVLLGIMHFSAYAQNLALNKPTSSSSDQGTGFESSFANDADATNTSYWSALTPPQWWKVDLGGIYELSSVVIRNFVDGVRYYHYNIEVSTDDVVYTQIAEKTNNNLAVDAGDNYIVTGTARFVRVNMLFNSINPGMHISDFQVFGTASVMNTITATVSAGGTITPAGTVMVKQGTSQTFTIAANTDYEITDVLVDGGSVGVVTTYTFTNVILDHTISAVVTPIPIYVITATANTGGTIDPPGDQLAQRGTGNYVYNIAPKSDFQLADVLVDGISVGALSTYTFNNVQGNRTIEASFTVKPHLALNKTATSPDHLLDWVPGMAVDADGSNNTYWAGVAYPTSWSVDLGGVYSLGRIVIRNYVELVRFYHYNIEVSTDNVTYTQIAEKTNDDVATDDGDTYTINASGRYLRVNIIFNSGNPGAHISDFRVYSNAILTVTGVTVADKVYDGTTAATLNTGGATLVGVVPGDVVSLVSTGATGTFDTKTKGINKTVTTAGFTLAGADAFKYTLTQPASTGVITAKALTVTGLTAVNKVYNGNTTAPFSGTPALNGIILPDVVTPGGTVVAVFASKNVGTGIAVSVTGITLTGADAVNYTVTQPTGLVANITPKALTITGITADNKEYDGNTTATLSGTAALAGVVVPDVVTLGGTPVATFASPDVADGIAVTVTGYTISGADAGNYTLTQPAGLTANITVTTGVEDITGGKLSVSVYPNPTTDFVTLNVVNNNNEKLSYVLIDGRGNILENKQITSNKTLIPLQNKLSGTYFIKVTGKNRDIKTIKIIKN